MLETHMHSVSDKRYRMLSTILNDSNFLGIKKNYLLQLQIKFLLGTKKIAKIIFQINVIISDFFCSFCGFQAIVG